MQPNRIASTAAADHTFSKEHRLLSARDYREVFADVCFKAGQQEFVLLARPGQHTTSRLGLAVARKHLRRAVERNRLKRLAREVFRQLPASTKVLDIVLLSRPAAAGAPRDHLHAALRLQFAQLQRRAEKHA